MIPSGLRPDSLIVFPDTTPRISTFNEDWRADEKDESEDDDDDTLFSSSLKANSNFTDLALGEMLEAEEKLLIGKDSLAWVAWQLRKNLLIATRKKGLKKFKDAFFGTHVIGWFLHAGFCQDTEEGAQLANDLLQRGYLKFCDRNMRGKAFLHDKAAVYQFTSLSLVVTAQVTLKDLLQTNTAHSGYLKKYAEGKKVGGKWKSRFFCLSIATGALMYFYNPECVFPLGFVPLHQILFCTLTGKKGRTLTLVCWDRVMKLKAETIHEATAWQQAVESAMEPALLPNRAPPSPKTPPEHKEEWLQADQSGPNSELFKIEQDFFKLMVPPASYYTQHPDFLRKIAWEFPSVGEVMEIIVDVLLNPKVPDNVVLPDRTPLLLCVSKNVTYLQDSRPKANVFKVLPDLFAPVRAPITASPQATHKRTGSGGKVEKRNSLAGKRSSQIRHARVFSAVYQGEQGLSGGAERMEAIRDIITIQLSKGNRGVEPSTSLSLSPSLALPDRVRPLPMTISPHLAAFVKTRSMAAMGGFRSRFGSAAEGKREAQQGLNPSPKTRNASLFSSFTTSKGEKQSLWVEPVEAVVPGSNSVLKPAAFVETEWNPDDHVACRAHVLSSIMAPHRDFSENIGEMQVLSTKNGVPMAWVYFQRFYHSSLPEVVHSGQEDHWKKNFKFECEACSIASDKFVQFLITRIGGKNFRLSHGNSILAVVVTEAQRFCIDLMEPQTKRYNVLGRTVVNPGAWIALLRCLQCSNMDVRRHTLKDVYSCVISNADNARSLLAVDEWPRLLLALLSDLPVETLSGGTTDGIDAAVQNVLLCMERIWLFVMNIIAELLRITFMLNEAGIAQASGVEDSDREPFREGGSWLEFRKVFQKCFADALAVSACEAPKHRLTLPRQIMSSLLMSLRKRAVNHQLNMEGVHWSRLSFLSSFISNFVFSYVSIMQPLVEIPQLPAECRNAVLQATKANPVAFSCLSSVKYVRPRMGFPSLAPKENRNSLSISPRSRSPQPIARLGDSSPLGAPRGSMSSFTTSSPSHSHSPSPRDCSSRNFSRSKTEDFIAVSPVNSEVFAATNEFAFRLLNNDSSLSQYYHSSFDIHPFTDLTPDRMLIRSLIQLLAEVGVFSDVGRKGVSKPEKRKQIHEVVSANQDQLSYLWSTVEVNLPGSRQMNDEELEVLRELQGQVCWLSDVHVFLGMMSSRMLCLSHQERLALVHTVRTAKNRDKVFRGRAVAEKSLAKKGEEIRFSTAAQHSWPLTEDASVAEVLLCDRDVRVPPSTWPRAYHFLLDESKTGTLFAGEKGLEVLNQAVADKLSRSVEPQVYTQVESRSSRSREGMSRSGSKSDLSIESIREPSIILPST